MRPQCDTKATSKPPQSLGNARGTGGMEPAKWCSNAAIKDVLERFITAGFLPGRRCDVAPVSVRADAGRRWVQFRESNRVSDRPLPTTRQANVAVVGDHSPDAEAVADEVAPGPAHLLAQSR